MRHSAFRPFLFLLVLFPWLVAGQAVQFAATFGGSGSDTVFAVRHHEGFSYVAGRTTSADFPVTDGSTYRGDSGETGDIFVAKLNAQGQIVAATLLGGSGPDFANGIAITDGPGPEPAAKVITISGWTGSTDFRTLNPIQAANGGKTDAVIAQFDLNLNLLFSTYLGGAEDDQFSGLTAIVSNVGDDDLMFFGFTTSTDFPFPTPNAADPTTTVKNLTTNADGLLVRMNRDRTVPMASLLRRTSSGNGTQNEVILAGTSGLTIPGSGFSPAQYGLYVTGWTDNDFFRHSSDPTGSGRRIFLTEINPENGGRIYSRVLGGSGDDIGQAVAITAHGVVVLGQTTSTDLPNAQPLFQAAPGGGTDAVLVGWQHLPSGLPLFARPAYVAYLGGTGDDSGRALAAAFGPQFPQSAVAERLHFAGVTGSANLPLLASPQQPPAQATYGGGATDGFFGRLATVPNPESTGPAFLIEAKNLTFDGGTDDDAFTSVAAVQDDGTDFEGVAGGAVQIEAAEANGGAQRAMTRRERAKVTYYGKARSGGAADLAVVAQPRGPLAPGVEEILVLVITNKGSIGAQQMVLGVVPDQVIGVGLSAEIIRGTVHGQPDGLLTRDNDGRFLLGELTLAPGASVEIEVTLKSLPAALKSSPPAVGLSVGVFDRGGFVTDENPQDNAIVVNLPLAVSADVFVERTLVLLDPVTANPRQVRYEFRVSNVGTRTAELVKILLTGVNLKNVTYTLGIESLNVGQLDDPDPLQLSPGSLEVGESVVLVVVGELLRPSEGTRLTARGTAADELNTENNTATGETAATPLPDLTVLMQPRPPLTHDREEVVTLVITNQGTGPASGILLTIRPITFDDRGEPKDITADIVRITFSGAPLSQVDGQLVHTVSLGELVLAPGGSLEIDVALKSRPEALRQSPPAVHLSTVVDSREIDADETNNLRRFAVPVEVPTSDLDLGFDLPSDPVPAGTPFRIIMRVGNMGPDAGIPVVTLLLPPNLAVTEVPPACEPVGADESWVINAFLELFGRSPTLQELAEALPLIQSTGNRQATAQALLNSGEHLQLTVNRLYLALRGTPPTEAELNSAVLKLQAGTQLGVLALEILSALPATPAEVVTRVESDKAFLGEPLETMEDRVREAMLKPGFNLEDYLEDAVTPDLVNIWVPGLSLDELINLPLRSVLYECQLPELANGATTTKTFQVNPLHPGVYVLRAEIRGQQPDPNPANDREQGQVLVAGAQDFGDAPALGMNPALFPPILGTYPVLATDNGARHQVNPDVGLGNLTDTEADGQPHIYGWGDDGLAAAADDEDGVQFLSPPVVVFLGIGGPTPFPAVVAPSLGQAGAEVKVDVQVRAPVFGVLRLNAWVDFNRDGDWADPREQVIANKVVLPGVTQFQFTVPNDVESGLSFARFRLSSAETVDSTGPAPDGEVEDHLVLLGPLERGDAPAVYGAAPHLFPPNPVNFLGVKIDPDDVQPSADARADDTDADGDDEDGVTEIGPFFAGVTSSLVITASEDGFVDLWLDYNGVNGFEANPAAPDPTEYVNASIVGLPAGAAPAPFPVVKGANPIRFRVPDRLKSGLSFLRVRYTPVAIPALGPVSLAPTGEVEDYRVQLYPLAPDFGDAPDSRDVPQYPTLRVHNGAFHLVTEDPFFLGQRVDIEPDGLPSLNALGDDQDNGPESPADPEPDDEDGVRFLTPLTPGQPASVQLVVTAQSPGPAFVNAWVDFNGDFDWADPGEQVLVNAPVMDGTNVVAIAVPAAARPGNTYARFRLTRDQGLGFAGPATSGEVEDYPVTIVEPAGELRIGSIVQVGDAVELRWEVGVDVRLESGPTVNGPWSTVTGATSPFRVTPGAAGAADGQFYRLVQ